MKTKITLLFTLVSMLAYSTVFAQQSDLQTKSQQLSDVNKNIQAKKLEKSKLMMQEKSVRRELQDLNYSIARTEQNLQKIAIDIKTAENNLAAASQQYNASYAKSSGWNKESLADLERFHKMTMVSSYETDPVEYRIRKEALEREKNNFDKEKASAALFAADMRRWDAARKELLDLRAQENNLAAQKRQLIQQKSDLLKTTEGKRAAAEEEIKTLNENAKALQALIKKLAAANKKKKKTQPVIKAVSPQHKNNLPWPVEGKVIVNFGKSKNTDLDTYVISNGIKIKAADNSQVRSVDGGTVIFAGDFRSYGKVVIVDHDDSTFSVYGQLGQILVTENQTVLRGSVIARLGAGDDSVLYFEIRQDNIPDNPVLWLKAQ